jgi:carboxyl-terminal processing protease
MMNRSNSTTVLKVLTLTVAALIFGVAAFGIGVGVGHAQGQAAALAAFPQQAGAAQIRQPADAVAPAAAAPTPAPTRRAALPSLGKEDPKATTDESPLDMALFNEAWGLLKEQFYGDLPTGEDITYAAIKGVVQSLGDKHTGFLDPEQAAIVNASMEGSFEGIGAQVAAANPTEGNGGVLIEYLYKGQPAEKAGLRVDDVIVKVDGKDITGMLLNDAINLIRGPRDTEVTLTVRRAGEEPFDVKVTRARIMIELVNTKTVGDGKIEYISLSEFASTAPKLVTDALQKAVAKKPQGIILDLRGDPGGLLDSAVKIGSLFVPDGNIVIERFKDGKEQLYPREGRYVLDNTPLVVLVDGGSASASEIVAGAIQDAGTGTLIGETTYGKGSVQLPNMLSDKSQLRVTIAHWFTPKDREINGKGLEPDIKVPITEDDIKAKADPQLDRAVEFLLTGK